MFLQWYHHNSPESSWFVRHYTSILYVCVDRFCICVCRVFCSNSICLSLKSRSFVRSYQLPSDRGLWLIQEALVWHIWSPSMGLWMLTSADSTPLHLQLIAATVALLWKDLHLSQTCVCAGKDRHEFCTELTELNYSSVWSYNKIIVWTSNMLSRQMVVVQWSVPWHK